MQREDWNRKHGEGGLLFGAEPNRFLVDEVGDLEPGRALDVACGSGRNAVWLAFRGWRVTGVDFAGVALEQARGLAAERGVEVDWVEADLLGWRPFDAAFDLIIVLYLQLPAEQLAAVLRRASGGLAPGGTLLVVGHHSDNLEHGSAARRTRAFCSRRNRWRNRSPACGSRRPTRCCAPSRASGTRSTPSSAPAV